MSLSLAEILRVVEEVRPLLVGGRLENAWDAGPASLVLTFYAQREKRHLLLSAEPRFSRLHLAAERPEGKGSLSPFARSVRQALRGCPLHAVEAAAGDRIVALAFGRPEEPAGRLVAELTGRTSNLYLLGPTGHVVASLRTTRKAERDLRPGAPYLPPPPPPQSEAAARDRFTEALPCSEAIDRLYAEAEAEERVRALRQSLASTLKAARKRAQRLLDKLEADLARAEDADRLRLCGELLKLRLHEVLPRQASITVPNVFEPGSPDVEIPLEPGLSPNQNLSRYFRRYKKRVGARRQGEKRIAAAQAELDSLDARFLAVQEAAGLAELEALAAGRMPAPRHRPPERAAGPRRFLSADGLEILVGRSNAENDELTFRIARGNDLWVHVEGYTGPHVVVRTPRGKTVPKETLLDAATLAVHFSQLRRAGGGPVAYCARKFVTKPRGAGPGQVLYSQSKTLHIVVERSRLERLMGG